MSFTGPNIAGGTGAIFLWMAEKVLGGANKALRWGWERWQWAAAEDRYDERVIEQYGKIRILGQTHPKELEAVFTNVYVLDVPTALRRFSREELRRHLWEEDRSVPWRVGERLPAEKLLTRRNKFLILGKPGAGKTTFLKYLAVREAHRGAWGSCLGKTPIFVSLKQFAESGKTLPEFLVEQFDVCHFPETWQFVEPLLKSGKALVLFDGLDEVARGAAGEDPRKQVTGTIEQFARQYHGCHIVVTCRIAATEYTFDPGFIYLEMADFAPDQVESFVHHWFWNPDEPNESAALATRMLEEWERPEHAGIRDLGRSPLLLTLLCLNYAETLTFPNRRVEIYEEALGVLLKKWDASRQIQRGSVYKTLSPGRRQQMLARVAYDGFVQDEILFAQPDLEARLKAYLAHVPEVPEAIDVDAETVLREIVEQHGIFSEQSQRIFSFAHLTFQEYYAARYIADCASPDTMEALVGRVSDDKWREVFLLTASLLPDASPFLVAFERALHGLVAPYPGLVSWLRRIQQHAAASQAAYRQPAMRLWYTCALAHALDRDLDRALERARDRALALDEVLALDLDLDRARAQIHTLEVAVDIARDLDRGFPRDPARARARDSIRNLAHERVRDRIHNLAAIPGRIRESCQRHGYFALDQALSSLMVPPPDASSATWMRFAVQLREVIAKQGALGRCHLLQAETGALVAEGKERFQLGNEELQVLLAYLRASELFYDCLQLAYTPDRPAFEERIFLPAPVS